ncbi:MAG: hypothetical protein AAB403_14555 [Planctomycetota bacterium]
MPSRPPGILLASGWPVSKVCRSLRRRHKFDLINFLRERYDERFFQPIQLLRNAVGSHQGYGFAMMALCSLLVESIQCCRDGLPSTNTRELRNLAQYAPPPIYDVPRSERKTGPAAFRDFFAHFSSLFPDLDGEEFYRNIRNGLLHQAQTKNRWTIRVDSARLCEPTNRVINRDLFADRLRDAFEAYLTELRTSPRDSDIWRKARRKIWWLIRLSL